MDEYYQNFTTKAMSDKEFKIISDFIEGEVGIKMPPVKKTLLESRLQKRLRQLNLNSFKEYTEYVFHSDNADEIIMMIDLVTTNKTEFFRESAHYDFLLKKGLDDICKFFGIGAGRMLKVWSAGCSTGEEPYTLAMVLANYFDKKFGRWYFTIDATDISTRVLNSAKKGIYDEEKVRPVSSEMKIKYLMKSKDRSRKLVRVVPELREIITFSRLNFMDQAFGFKEKFDIIFCRNVIIYFDKSTQEKLFNKFYHNMNKSGYLFIGHSETLNGINAPFSQVVPTVYKSI